ncbi:MAG: hypothetical protein MRY63_08335 [Neomegalonema sp.]|nr:hypothetical protein [Neomegalonema sp.]
MSNPFFQGGPFFQVGPLHKDAPMLEDAPLLEDAPMLEDAPLRGRLLGMTALTPLCAALLSLAASPALAQQVPFEGVDADLYLNGGQTAPAQVAPAQVSPGEVEPNPVAPQRGEAIETQLLPTQAPLDPGAASSQTGASDSGAAPIPVQSESPRGVIGWLNRAHESRAANGGILPADPGQSAEQATQGNPIGPLLNPEQATRQTWTTQKRSSVPDPTLGNAASSEQAVPDPVIPSTDNAAAPASDPGASADTASAPLGSQAPLAADAQASTVGDDPLGSGPLISGTPGPSGAQAAAAEVAIEVPALDAADPQAAPSGPSEPAISAESAEQPSADIASDISAPPGAQPQNQPETAISEDPLAIAPQNDALIPPGPNEPVRVVPAVPTRVSGASVGIASARSTGLPVDAWRDASPTAAVKAIRSLRPTDLRSVNALAIRLLSAAYEAPRDVPSDKIAPHDFLDARLHALLDFGAIDAAASLGEAAPRKTALDAVGTVDAALLKGEDERMCRLLFDQPRRARQIDPGLLPYCQIASGDLLAAQLTIEAARSLGDGDAETLELLAAAADPLLAEITRLPKRLDKMSALQIAALRRAGIALPTDFVSKAQLPHLAALSLPDSNAPIPPRNLLEILERLEISGALSSDALAEAFASASSAESGGVWGRVEAFKQTLNAGADGLDRSLTQAYERADTAGRRGSMLRILGYRAPLIGQVASDESARDALRLVGRAREVGVAMLGTDVASSAEERVLQRIADPRYVPPQASADVDELLARAVRGEQDAGRRVAALIALRQIAPQPSLFALRDAAAFSPGESPALAAFEALAALRKGASVPARTLFESLSILVALGLEADAREIAVEAIILGS